MIRSVRCNFNWRSSLKTACPNPQAIWVFCVIPSIPWELFQQNTKCENYEHHNRMKLIFNFETFPLTEFRAEFDRGGTQLLRISEETLQIIWHVTIAKFEKKTLRQITRTLNRYQLNYSPDTGFPLGFKVGSKFLDDSKGSTGRNFPWLTQISMLQKNLQSTFTGTSAR